MSMQPSLAISQLSVHRQQRLVLEGIDCEVAGGALVGILGPNGAGKTSLLEAILGWLPATSGRISVDGRMVRSGRGNVSYLAQRHQLDAGFPLLVSDVVAMGRYQELGFARRFSAQDHALVAASMQELGVEDLATRHIAQLSGGQLQRALLARSLCTRATTFLLDEPLAGLDPVAGRDLMARLAGWRLQGRLVVLVLHDLGIAREFCSHVLLLNRRQVAWGPTQEVMTRERLESAFGPYLAHQGLVQGEHTGMDAPHG